MAPKYQEPTHYVVGDDGEQGLSTLVFTTRCEAEEEVRRLIELGVQPSDVIWVEGHRKVVTAEITLVVEAFTVS